MSLQATKLLLKSRKSRQYYMGFRQWGDRPEFALGFGSVPEAARFAADNGLRGVEIVLAFGDRRGREVSFGKAAGNSLLPTSDSELPALRPDRSSTARTKRTR